MSFVLVTPKEELNLGNPFKLLSSWGELARAMGENDGRYENLLFVPYTDERKIPADIFAKMKAQATVARAEYADELGEHTRWLLEQIAGQEEHAGWDPSKHPRHPSGTEDGGEFAPKEGGVATVDDPATDLKVAEYIDDETYSHEAESFLLLPADELAAESEGEDEEGSDFSATNFIDPITRSKMKAKIVRSLAADLRKSGVTADEAKLFAEEMTPALAIKHPEDPYEWAAQKFVDRWASSSGDTDDRSIAFQMRARDKFNLDNFAPWDRDDQTSELLIGNARQLANRHKTVIDALLDANYQATQKKLKAEGVEELLLYRGMAVPKKGYPYEVGTLAFDKVRMQPLSSFTSSLGTSMQFAHDNSDPSSHVLIMAVRVPRSHIFSTSVTGIGCLSEGEYVIMGRKGGARVAHAAYDPADFAAGGTWFNRAAREWVERRKVKGDA